MALLLQAAELVLAHAASSVQWVGYLSSTSVYGDWGGNWVDERSEHIFCVLPVSLAHVVHAAGYAKLMFLIVRTSQITSTHYGGFHAVWHVSLQVEGKVYL